MNNHAILVHKKIHFHEIQENKNAIVGYMNEIEVSMNATVGNKNAIEENMNPSKAFF